MCENGYQLPDTYLCDVKIETKDGRTLTGAYYVEVKSEAVDWMIYDHKLDLFDIRKHEARRL